MTKVLAIASMSGFPHFSGVGGLCYQYMSSMLFPPGLVEIRLLVLLYSVDRGVKVDQVLGIRATPALPAIVDVTHRQRS